MPNDQPETIDAILAEMRREERPYGISNNRLRSYADRIERAAKNTENAFGMALAIEDGLHKRDKQSAPGNAAAMRAALEEQLRYWNSHVRTRDEEEMRKRTEAALAAPARNCDRFATAEEAVAAFADHLRAWENAHGICDEHPNHPVNVPVGAFAWLFATAREGGDHA